MATESIPAVRLGWLIAQIRVLISDPATTEVGGTGRITDQEIADIAFYQMLEMPVENAAHYRTVFSVFKAEGDDGDVASWQRWVFANFHIPEGKGDVNENARNDTDYPMVPIPPNQIWDLIKRILTSLGLRDAQTAVEQHLILSGAGHGALLAASGRTAQV